MIVAEVAVLDSKAASEEFEASFDQVCGFNRKGLFLGGCPKSGTTLLQALLDNHPQLMVFPRETHYMDERDKYKALGDFQSKLCHLITRSSLRSVEQAWRETSKEAVSQQPQFIYERFVQIAQSFVAQPWMNDSFLLSETIRAYAVTLGHNWQECMRWVEKTPSNVPYAEELFRLFPDAKLIHLLRDPRAVFASRRRLLLDRYGAYTKAHRLVREWNHSARQIERLRNYRDNCLVIRYEDLVRDSRGVMERICRFAGIDFLPGLLEPTWAGSDWHGNSAYFNALNGIDKQPLDRWKKELSASEIWWVDIHCRAGMAAAGYEPAASARFSFGRWMRRLPGESVGGYLRARKSSLCQMMGVLEDCRYSRTRQDNPPQGGFKVPA